MVKCAKIILIAVIFVSIFPQIISAFQDTDKVRVYREQPLEVHLYIADIKIDEMSRNAQSQGNSETLKQLEEANYHLLMVLRNYEFKAKYRYAYTWEGNPIKALALVHKRGQQANLLVCLAMADSFDRNEFDRIIASYYH